MSTVLEPVETTVTTPDPLEAIPVLPYREGARKILVKAHELISDESRWTKYSRGRTRDGEATGPLSFTAVRWCAVGALQKAAGYRQYISPKRREEYFEALELLHREVGRHIMYFNDDWGHAPTVQAFSRAIAKL